MVSFSAYMRGTTKWISEAQEKGMKALQQHLQKAGRLTDQNSIWEAVAWLVQKDHESAEYFSKAIGDQISRLEDEIKLLQDQLRNSNEKEKESRSDAPANGKSQRKRASETKNNTSEAT